MNAIIDAHAHCGIQDQSMPQSYEDYCSQFHDSGIEVVVMFSPVVEIYDRYSPNFEDNDEWQQRRKISNEYLLKIGNSDLAVIPYFFMLIRCCLPGMKARPETLFPKLNAALVTNRAG
jgi:hypothetical protein